MKRVSCIFLAAVIVMTAGCGGIQSTNLMDEVEKKEVSILAETSDYNEAATDFAVRLFQSSLEIDKNTLISPLSVMSALAMTANGADGETLAQMENVLGFSTEDLNRYLHTYIEQLPEEESYKLSLANSIWVVEDENFSVEEDFLQVNADYYGAEIYKTPFDDSTVKDINNWVNENTDKMIPKILDQIPDEAVMYLVNALAFEAEWQRTYQEHQVRDAEFTLENGTVQNVELMYSEEDYYLEDEHATGFLKYYAQGKYAFAALLPEEGMKVEDYVKELTGERLHIILSNPIETSVTAAIPKFETAYDVEMSKILSEMGMSDAFSDELADFSRLGTSEDGNIFINRVLHKTFISVAEKGTKAGAVTVVEMVTESAMEMPEEPKEVILDRPFVYMLIDCENHVPFFIGTLMDAQK